MHVSYRWPAVVALAACLCTQAAQAGTHVDPSGFRLTYPKGWFAVGETALGEVSEGLPPGVKARMTRNNVDASQAALLVVREGPEGEFLENLNVVVDPQQIPTTAAMLAKMKTMISTQYTAMGMQISNLVGAVEQVADRTSLVFEYEAIMPGEAEPLRQMQVMFPGGGKTYIVTCTGTLGSFEQYRGAFDGMLATFKAPEPIERSPYWTKVATTAVLGGIIGGVVGVIGWLVSKLSNKSRIRPKGSS